PPDTSPLSLHDALPIYFVDRHGLAERDGRRLHPAAAGAMRHDVVALEIDPQVGDLIALPAVEAMRVGGVAVQLDHFRIGNAGVRSEEHTSELQSRSDLV